MRIVKIPFAGGDVIYPDDEKLFKNTRHIPDQGLLVGEYYGVLDPTALPDYIDVWPPVEITYRTRVMPGEIISLMGKQGYAKVYRAAYPQGNKAEDDEALVFFERARFPTAEDGLIDVSDYIVTAALDYFILQGYIADADKIRIQQGVPE